MPTRITIDLPRPLAHQIAELAATHLRFPKQQIIWLLQEAVRTSTPLPTTPEPHTQEARHADPQ